MTKVKKGKGNSDVIEHESTIQVPKSDAGDWKPPPRVLKYRVAKGKAIGCAAGVKSEGDPIYPRYFSNKQFDLDKLVTSGHIEAY